MITLYGHNRCKMVKATRRYLDSRGVEYTYVDVDKDHEGQQFVLQTNNGYFSVPTLKFPDGSTLTEPDYMELEAKMSSLDS